MKNSGMKLKKFATQIDETALEDLRAYAKSTGRSISGCIGSIKAILPEICRYWEVRKFILPRQMVTKSHQS